MSSLTLEPVALRQEWGAAQPLESREWTALFAGYLGRLAQVCDRTGPCLIGHIKLLALFDGGAYLRVSAISATHPPTITGAAPEGQARIDTTLNVLVYGLTAPTLAALASEVAAEVAAQWSVTATKTE